jgi:SAM-dependent methyltransferase
MDSPTTNIQKKTRRNKVHLRKTLKNNPNKTTQFESLFHGFNGRGVDSEKYKGHHITYGEITERGLHICSKLFEKYCPLDKVPLENRNFYDLGCGLGKFVIGMSILHPQIRSIGIDIVEERVEQARIVLHRVPAKTVQKRSTFHVGSFLEDRFHFNNACWIFISNLCIGDDVLAPLLVKLKTEMRPGSILLCSRDFPDVEDSGFVKREITPVPMSWSEKSNIIVYQRV